jgi:polygalacturonase
LTEKEWRNTLEKGGVIEKESDENIWWPDSTCLEGKIYNDRQEGKCLDMNECLKYHRFFRPVMVSITGCKKVLIDGPTFQNSPAWCLHPRNCEDLTIKNIYVRNPWYSQNGDGIDVESCTNVVIECSEFDVGDDAICIKSGKNEDGRKNSIATTNVVIRDCRVYHGHGGFVIGSEMSAGVRDIFVYNCDFIGTDIGLRFKSCKGRGGTVENIHVENIRMKNIVNEAILFSLGYNLHVKDEEFVTEEDIPKFREFYIQNITCEKCDTGISINGLSESPIENVYFNDIFMLTRIGLKKENCKNISFENVTLYENRVLENGEDTRTVIQLG